MKDYSVWPFFDTSFKGHIYACHAFRSRHIVYSIDTEKEEKAILFDLPWVMGKIKETANVG